MYFIELNYTNGNVVKQPKPIFCGRMLTGVS